MRKATAETLWCPVDAMTLSNTDVCTLVGEIDGANVTVAAVNRNADGSAHPNCLCISDRCMSWVQGSSDPDVGFCSRLGDNRSDDDGVLEA